MPTDINQINEGDNGSSPTENANATEVDIVAAGALLGRSAGVPIGADNADDTTAVAGIDNGTTTTTNEGGAAAAQKTPRPKINHLGHVSHPDTVNVHLHGGPSSAENPTASDGCRDAINNGGKLLYDNDEEEEEEDVNDDRKVAATEKYSTTENEMDDDGKYIDEERGVAADDTTAVEVQSQLTDEDRLKGVLPLDTIAKLISSNQIKFGNNSNKVYELTEAVTLDVIVPSEEDVDLPGLKPFDVDMLERPNTGMYFILLLCPGGKWKVLYGISEGGSRIGEYGLYLRIKSHLSLHEQEGEVLV